MLYKRRHPPIEPSVTLTTYAATRALSRVTIHTTRRSAISGSERNDESRKATKNSPKTPSVNAKARTASAILLIE